MVKKITLEEQIGNISKLISYDRSLTLIEQKPDNLMPFQPDRPEYKKKDGTLDTQKHSADLKQATDLIYEYRHGLMDIAAIGTMFIPVVGPFISLGLELSNAGMYFAEGENYSGGLALAFALIPGGELIARIPAVKKLGNEGLKKLLQKTTIKNAKYTDDEIEALKQINSNKSWIAKTASKQAVKKTIETGFKGAPLSKVVRVMYNMGKKYPKTVSVTKMGLTIGGIWYSYDKLAEIYGIKNKSEITTPTQTTPQSSKPKVEIVTDFGDNWDYKKEGDKYFAKRKGTDKWILATGKSEEAIKTKVFKTTKDTYQPTKEDLAKRKELDKLYNTNPKQIISQIAPTLSSSTEEEKNKQVIDAFSDILDDYKTE